MAMRKQAHSSHRLKTNGFPAPEHMKLLDTTLGMSTEQVYKMIMTEDHIVVLKDLFTKLIEFKDRKGWVKRLDFTQDEIFMMEDYLKMFEENGVQE